MCDSAESNATGCLVGNSSMDEEAPEFEHAFLFLLLVASSTLIGRSCRRQLAAQTFTATAARFCAKGDLLPLPFHIDPKVKSVLQMLGQSGKLSGVEGKALDEVGTRCWQCAATKVLNHQWHCPQSESGGGADKLQMADPTGSPTRQY